MEVPRQEQDQSVKDVKFSQVETGFCSWLRKFKSDTKSRIFQSSGANVTKQATGTAPHNWAYLWSLLKSLEQAARPFAPLKAAVGELAECVDVFEGVLHGRKEYESLYNELERLFQMLQNHCTQNIPPAITVAVESLCKSLQDEADSIRRRQDKGKIRGYLEAGQDAEESQCDPEKHDLGSVGGERASSALGLDTRIYLTDLGVTIGKQVDRVSIEGPALGLPRCQKEASFPRPQLNVDMSIRRIVYEIATDNRLKHLSPSLSARYNSAQAIELKRGPCAEGTRADLLTQMFDWVGNSDLASVYWMSGMAGTGKTTIAYSLCLELEAKRRLAASFFFRALVTSISLCVVEQDPDVHTQLLHIQFDSLISQPLLKVKETLPDSLVVVIDALDECENKESTNQILDVLLTKSVDLPVKFVMSSRPEPEMRDGMSNQPSRVRSRVVLHELDEDTVQSDIETYLRTTLAKIHPTDDQIVTLVERARILFIYAATVVRYLSHDRFRRNPLARLANITRQFTSDFWVKTWCHMYMGYPDWRPISRSTGRAHRHDHISPSLTRWCPLHLLSV
ncbi:hypothetical protein RSAG8_05501, partial [Rhizoctonia solani AG-8 WAC10335]